MAATYILGPFRLDAFVIRNLDADDIIRLVRFFLIHSDVRRHHAQYTIQFRCRALIECREPQHRFLAEMNLVDVLRRDLDLDHELRA